MAPEKLGPHRPTIIDAKHIEAIYELWGVAYAVEIEHPDDGETPKTVRPGLGELKQLFAIKQNSGFPGTRILAPRAGQSIIDGIPNRDDRWIEKFFVFTINPVSVGDFDFGRIPREWSGKIEPFSSTPMTPDLRGLIATLQRGNPQWLAFTVDRIRAACALPPGENRATLFGLQIPFDQGRVVTEYNEGGFELEEELERLKDQEISLDVDYGLASVLDPSFIHLELPEVPGDSVDQKLCED
ncbi:hypothetical protein YC2023_024264 [Brassica napus]|uniref:Uncharacterized protein n=1 Tax=Brassica campestris TaxID=3711 RepID=M4FH73_BRACM